MKPGKQKAGGRQRLLQHDAAEGTGPCGSCNSQGELGETPARPPLNAPGERDDEGDGEAEAADMSLADKFDQCFELSACVRCSSREAMALAAAS